MERSEVYLMMGVESRVSCLAVAGVFPVTLDLVM